MNQNSNAGWRSDPRLRGLNPERIKLLTDFADQLSRAPQNAKMSTFLSINQKMYAQNLRFSADERDLLMSILTERMSEDEKKTVRMIQEMAAKMQRR